MVTLLNYVFYDFLMKNTKVLQFLKLLKKSLAF